jgi:hypothetical protein
MCGEKEEERKKTKSYITSWLKHGFPTCLPERYPSPLFTDMDALVD